MFKWRRHGFGRRSNAAEFNFGVGFWRDARSGGAPPKFQALSVNHPNKLLWMPQEKGVRCFFGTLQMVYRPACSAGAARAGGTEGAMLHGKSVA